MLCRFIACRNCSRSLKWLLTYRTLTYYFSLRIIIVVLLHHGLKLWIVRASSVRFYFLKYCIFLLTMYQQVNIWTYLHHIRHMYKELISQWVQTLKESALFSIRNMHVKTIIVFYIILFLRWVGNPMSSRTTGRLIEMLIDSEHV